MKRSFVAIASALIIMSLFTPAAATAVFPSRGIGESGLASGIVTVQAPPHASAAASARKKLVIQSGDDRLAFVLPPDFVAGDFPLTFGNGAYRITLYERTGSGTYRKLMSGRVKLALKDEKLVFRQSIQPIRWTTDMTAVRMAASLAGGLKTDIAKTEAVYRYLVERMRYDYGKPAAQLPPEYAPDIQATFRTGTGICYDTAALFAAMLRSSGVPVKLVKGYAPNVKEYHAWNEVYLQGRGWVTVDVTSDAQYYRAGVDVPMMKDASKYTTSSAF